MKSFLQNLAEETLKKHPSLDGLTIVFPNRRAVLYFRKHLSSLLTQPAFAPRINTIEEFVSGLSALHVPDRLELIHRLYTSYNAVMNTRQDGEETMSESFDQFYFWGDMLLRDFDEIDKYMVDARMLFRDLSNQKELDAGFDFLTDEQKEFLLSFWGNFNVDLNANKRKFLRVWRLLADVYDTYREQLGQNGLAYEGMLYREVAEGLRDKPASTDPGQIIFAGYNALTGAEEKIITHFVSAEKAEVHWDLDAYYVNNTAQEAGRFFRSYQRHEILKKTFVGDTPSNFSGKKNVQLFGSAQHVGQAKLMSQVLEEQLGKGFDPEDTLIVLPDEKLLLPVLHGVSGHVDKLNVTMGFPLASTPIFNLVEFLVELQLHQRTGLFNHRQVLALLSHPYVVSADPSHANRYRKEILEKNQVSIHAEILQAGPPLYSAVFRALEGEGLLEYLREVIHAIGSLQYLTDLDKEYTFHALTLVNRLEEVMGSTPAKDAKNWRESLKSFSRLFRQLGRSQKIPFTGEPLKGLQIMGVLETRNLDYKNVFVLSLNEGALPASGNKASYVPYNIRKAYSLPTAEHQDAMYAYLFYRVLQRAENVFLFYNTETDILGQGEMSRFVQQILLESGWKIQRKVLHSPVQPRPITPITIEKSEQVLQDLTKLNEGNKNFKGISPSALNTYIDCPLQFYLKHVAKIREPKEVEENLDARLFGNLLHNVMEKFYRRIQEKKKSPIIQSTDFEHYKETVSQLIDEAFILHYGIEAGRKLIYEGQRLVVREVIRSFVERIVEHDKAYTPFTIEGLERGELLYYAKIENAPGQAVLSGKIDRLDRKGDVVRVLDYKTGRGDLDFASLESLFDGSGPRNRAVFQTLIYALLYRANHNTAGVRLAPGLISRLNLFDEALDHRLILNKIPVDDAEPLLEEFEGRLKSLLEEMFDPNTPFKQTQNLEACKFCLFQNICYR
ncbi:MAG: PD-(D/E)XK nuclease family protein [Cytophagales bacterium]|nr:PD-(D/E)XK nuclease family protein [Cytophagales bacterium]